MPGAQCVGVLGAEDPVAVGERALAELDRIHGASRLPVRGGEHRGGAQPAMVLWAKARLAVREHALAELDRLRCAPRIPVAAGEDRTGAQRSRCLGPRICCAHASACVAVSTARARGSTLSRYSAAPLTSVTSRGPASPGVVSAAASVTACGSSRSHCGHVCGRRRSRGNAAATATRALTAVQPPSAA